MCFTRGKMSWATTLLSRVRARAVQRACVGRHAGNAWGAVHAQWNRATACCKQQHPEWFKNKSVCSNKVCRFCHADEAAVLRLEMEMARKLNLRAIENNKPVKCDICGRKLVQCGYDPSAPSYCVCVC